VITNIPVFDGTIACNGSQMDKMSQGFPLPILCLICGINFHIGSTQIYCPEELGRGAPTGSCHFSAMCTDGDGGIGLGLKGPVSVIQGDAADGVIPLRPSSGTQQLSGPPHRNCPHAAKL